MQRDFLIAPHCADLAVMAAAGLAYSEERVVVRHRHALQRCLVRASKIHLLIPNPFCIRTRFGAGGDALFCCESGTPDAQVEICELCGATDQLINEGQFRGSQ